jgi:hypothetical protein
MSFYTPELLSTFLMAGYGTNHIPNTASETREGKRDEQVTVAFLTSLFIGWYHEFREKV